MAGLPLPFSILVPQLKQFAACMLAGLASKKSWQFLYFYWKRLLCEASCEVLNMQLEMGEPWLREGRGVSGRKSRQYEAMSPGVSSS